MFRSLFATDDWAARAIAAAAEGKVPASTTGTQLVDPMLKAAGLG